MAGTSQRKQTGVRISAPAVIDVPLEMEVDKDVAAELEVRGEDALKGHPELVKISKGVIDAAALGKSTETLGIVRITTGYVLTHQELLTGLQKRVCDQATGAVGDRLVNLSGAAAKIGNAVARLVKESAGGMTSGPNKKGIRRKGFSVGQPVMIQQNYYAGTNAQKTD